MITLLIRIQGSPENLKKPAKKQKVIGVSGISGGEATTARQRHTNASWGHAPEKILEFPCLLVASGAFSANKLLTISL